MSNADTPNCIIVISWLGTIFINSVDSIVLLSNHIFNSALNIGWLVISSIDGADSMVLLSVLIFINKIA